MAETPVDPPPSCTNCFEPLPRPRPRFCPQCGQETTLRPPKIGEFIQQFGGAFISTEGALWRTLVLLLFKPGELTRQYLAGRRKHYVLPLRMYLTISLLVLLLMRVMTTVGLEDGAAIRFDSTAPTGSIELGFGRAGMKDGQFFCENLPVWMCRRAERRFGGDAKVLEREMAELSTRFIGNLGGAMFLLLPAFALFMKLVYWNRGLRYTEHLVFALHVHAFWFIGLALSIGNLQWVSIVALLSVPVYGLLAMRRVYGGRWRWLLARACVVSLLYLIVLLLALAGVAIWSLLF